MIKFLDWQKLCRRWRTTQADLAKLIADGHIRAFYSSGPYIGLLLVLCDNPVSGGGLTAHDEYAPDSNDDDHAYLYRPHFTLNTVVALMFAVPDVKELELKFRISSDKLPIDIMDIIYPEDSLVAPVKEKVSDTRPMPKPRVAYVYDEAVRLHRKDPLMDRTEARKKINADLDEQNEPPYSRSQFNLIIKGIGIPNARRGRKPGKKKK